MGSRLRFEFRNCPPANVHEYAMNAAERAETAIGQGKFWEMHDFLSEHQETLEEHDVALAYAELLRLDVERFELEIAGHVHQRRIKEDFRGGVRSGVNETPTFFVNGVRHDGPAKAIAILTALGPAIEL